MKSYIIRFKSLDRTHSFYVMAANILLAIVCAQQKLSVDSMFSVEEVK